MCEICHLVPPDTQHRSTFSKLTGIDRKFSPTVVFIQAVCINQTAINFYQRTCGVPPKAGMLKDEECTWLTLSNSAHLCQNWIGSVDSSCELEPTPSIRTDALRGIISNKTEPCNTHRLFDPCGHF